MVLLLRTVIRRSVCGSPERHYMFVSRWDQGFFRVLGVAVGLPGGKDVLPGALGLGNGWALGANCQ